MSKRQADRNARRRRRAVAIVGGIGCLLAAAVVVTEGAGASYRRAEIWYGTRRVVSGDPSPRTSDTQLKSKAREVLDQARQHAQRGDVATARRFAEWAQRCDVTWHAGEISPESFLASLPPAGFRQPSASRDHRRRPKVSSYPGAFQSDRYADVPESSPVIRLPADTETSQFDASPATAWPTAPAARDTEYSYPNTNPLRHDTYRNDRATPSTPTAVRPQTGATAAPARRSAPVVAQAPPLGGFWAGVLAGIAIIVLLIVGLLWRLKARGGAVLRLEFLTPQGLDEARLAALVSTLGAHQPGNIPLAASNSPRAAPQPVEAPETFADKKLKVAQQREKREAAIVEHIFQENVKLREQFQSNKLAAA